MTDWIGRDGLERAYDDVLRGQRGVSWQRRYATNLVEEEILPGGFLRPLAKTSSIPSTWDSNLRRVHPGGKKGGIAAVDPRNGQILALASSPGFNLDLFRGGIQQDDFAALMADPGKPFVDRSTGKGGGGYPPGSVFKIVTTIAGLQSEIINSRTTFSCGGSIAVGHQQCCCHKRGGHGTLDLLGGFRGSCDVYYYRVEERLGPVSRGIRAWVGIGRQVGIAA